MIEPHFSKTYLDGAAILVNKENPVIGLTLRHDRLDNFWFTLMHELAHISLHYNQDISLFYDELETASAGLDEKEQEADELAEESLLPKAKWEVSPARLIPSSMAANSLAKELGVHVAIIAGQIRHKGNKYIYLNKIISEAKVRSYFADENGINNMFNSKHYVPMLKWKRAEQGALEVLTSENKKYITPVIQFVMPKQKPQDTLEDVVARFKKQLTQIPDRIIEVWGNEPIFIDFSLLFTTELKVEGIKSILISGYQKHTIFIPVIHLNDEKEIKRCGVFNGQRNKEWFMFAINTY